MRKHVSLIIVITFMLQGYFFKYTNLVRLPKVVSAQSCPPLLLEDPKNSI